MAEKPRTPGFETLAIHAGATPDPTTGARSTPIYQTTAYVFDDVDHAASLFNLQTYGYIYSRLTNPTVSVLEERVASLEGGRGAIAVASGHAAQMLAFFSFMQPGDQFLASGKLYGGSHHPVRPQLQEIRLGVRVRRRRRPREFPPRAHAALQGDLRREPAEPGRRRRRSRGHRRHRP